MLNLLSFVQSWSHDTLKIQHVMEEFQGLSRQWSEKLDKADPRHLGH
jgi:hypothetical protein